MKFQDNIASSFRDPSGFLFYKNNLIYRQVNISYKENYDHLMESGLYKILINKKLLIPHREVDASSLSDRKSYKTIKPELIPFISYPYEWSFSQLKNAALTTIKIQKYSLDFGMSLKDCSAYNIQFFNGKPIFIDTLSFEKFEPNKPWIAYRQFCQHFLAPLALMSCKDIRLNQLFKIHIDGIPLDLASSLLPIKTYFKFFLLTHIHLHAKSQKHFSKKPVKLSKHKMGHQSLLSLIDNLESAITKLKWKPRNTEWAKYYEIDNYSLNAHKNKNYIVADFINKINPKNVWDLGANTGTFSRISSEKGIMTISIDSDPAAVEKNYLKCVEKNEANILPLLLDITNPSPGIGWQNQERLSLLGRGSADTVLALALIHHLAISNNLPFDKIATFFSKICKSLIIEFIPKSDSQIQKLLLTREDIFTYYTEEIFRKEFEKYFKIKNVSNIKESQRKLYLMTLQ